MRPLTRQPDSLPPGCADVARTVWDFLDGRLDASRADELGRHLTACAPCHRYAEFQRLVIAFTTAPRAVRPDSGLRARVHAVLRQSGFVPAAP